MCFSTPSGRSWWWYLFVCFVFLTTKLGSILSFLAGKEAGRGVFGDAGTWGCKRSKKAHEMFGKNALGWAFGGVGKRKGTYKRKGYSSGAGELKSSGVV